MAIHDDGLSPEAMLAFYQRLYPFKSIFHWLNHEQAPTRLFINREFAFTLQGDVYLRYNSFTNADELKKQVCTLNPTRFEIGPVYSARVSCPDPLPPAGFPITNPSDRAARSQETRKPCDQPPSNHSDASSCLISTCQIMIQFVAAAPRPTSVLDVGFSSPPQSKSSIAQFAANLVTIISFGSTLVDVESTYGSATRRRWSSTTKSGGR